MANAMMATMTMMVLTAASLLLTTTTTCPGALAVSLGAVGPLFPFMEGDSNSNSNSNNGNSAQQQEPYVWCEEQILELMCDTCPPHLPVCSLDLAGCSWDCLSRSAARDTNVFN